MNTARMGWMVTLAMVGVLTGVSVATGRQDTGWKLPADAANEQSLVRPTPETIAAGKELFVQHCQRCHGAGGRGDGPDASLRNPPADLTRSMLFALNPDGVMFWKVMIGRQMPRMPGFQTVLSREQVWQAVHFAKTFRKSAPTQ